MYVGYKITIFLSFIASLLIVGYIMLDWLLRFIVYFITILYIAWGVYHLIIFYTGIRRPYVNKSISNNNDKIVVKEYPKISLIIPVRAEPIVSRTIEAALLHNSYPLEKKEVIVVTEDEDMARIAYYYQHRYPENVKVLLRQNYFPTKPSALNDSLALCTGDVIGVIDAEDILEHDLLHKVVDALSKYDVVQVMLLTSNINDSWISKMFAVEYAGWFRIWLNGRARLRLYTPLGGTGNYLKRSVLKEVGVWDPLNLAEDAELAVRLLLAGKSIGVVDARHWEEAPVGLKAWIKQRSRWYRGWLQSLYTYMPMLFKPSIIKRIGLANVLATLCMLIAPLVVALGFVAYSFTMLWLLEYTHVLNTTITQNLFPSYAIVPLLFNLIYYVTWFMGAKLQGIRFTIKDIPYAFVYMNVMMPIAAYRALYQCIFKEVYWEKTKHEGRGARWAYDSSTGDTTANTTANTTASSN